MKSGEVHPKLCQIRGQSGEWVAIKLKEKEEQMNTVVIERIRNLSVALKGIWETKYVTVEMIKQRRRILGKLMDQVEEEFEPEK